MFRTRIALWPVVLLIFGLAFSEGCSGVHQRPWLFPNRSNKDAAAGVTGNPKVELRPPSGDLPAEAPVTIPPLSAPLE